MHLAYSTNAFTRTSLSAALSAIADLGYAGAEILCDRPHWFAGEVDGAQADRLGQWLADRGLALSNVNANTAIGYYRPAPPETVFEPSLSSPDPALRAWRCRYTIEALRLARRVGAPCISLTSGRCLPGCPPARARAYFRDSLLRVCEAAARHEVRVGIEYEPGLLVERASEVGEIIETVGSPLLGVNLDIGHSYLQHEMPEQIVPAFQGRIWNVHVEDIKDGKHYHLVPGEGDLPFVRYLDSLRAAGYTGFLTVELYTYPHAPVEAGRRAHAYLAALLRNAA